MANVKTLALLFVLVGLVVFGAEEQEGNFTIRFEPTAKLQSNVEVPFEVRVKDAHGQPLDRNAFIEMTIAPEGQPNAASLRAWLVQPGVFIAKPVFPADGQWTVTVLARWQGRVTRRSIDFSVAP